MLNNTFLSATCTLAISTSLHGMDSNSSATTTRTFLVYVEYKRHTLSMRYDPARDTVGDLRDLVYFKINYESNIPEQDKPQTKPYCLFEGVKPSDDTLLSSLNPQSLTCVRTVLPPKKQ